VVHLAGASAAACDVVGVRGVAGGELLVAAGHVEDDGMARGQSLGSDAEGVGLFCGGERGGLRRGIVFGNAAAIADALDRAAEIRGIFCVLCVAAGGAEFVSDEPFAGGVGEAGAGGAGGGSFVRGAALAESSAGAADVRWRSGDGVAVCAGTEYFAAGAGAGDLGCAGVVGVSDGVAPFDAGGAGVFDVWEVGGRGRNRGRSGDCGGSLRPISREQFHHPTYGNDQKGESYE